MNRQRKDLNVIFQDIHEMENYIKTAKSTGGILKIIRVLPDTSIIIQNLISLTSFLNIYNPDITTRVYYLNHKLTNPLLCDNCGKLLPVNVLRRLNDLNFCDKQCSQEYTNKQRQIKKEASRLKFNTDQELVDYIQSMQCTASFYKQIQNNYPEICQRIEHITSFLNDIPDTLNVLNLQYRIYYIFHHIEIPQQCALCSNLLPLSVIRQRGKYCSTSCYNKIPKSEESLQKVSATLKATWAKTSDEDKAARYKKVAENNIRKYGTKCTLNLPENIKKKKQTWLSKYGVDNPNKCQEQRDKIKKTNISRYGVASPALLTQPYERWKPWEQYTLPDGRIWNIQGWERQALDLYILPTYQLSDIEHNVQYMHTFNFQYSYDNSGTLHNYYPDFFIKSTKTFIEVKSDFTLYNDLYRNFKKFESVINKGYNIEICLITKVNNNKYIYEILTYEDIKNQAQNISTCK